MTERKACAVDLCERPATPRTDYCKQCGSVFGYWARRRVAHLLARRTFLKYSDNRMAIVAAKRGVK